MTFLDEAVVEFTSGSGGAGSASFHREKHVPRGGPNGADGGRGGDIVLVADGHVRTLFDFTQHRRFKAENGIEAVGNKDGRNGKSIEVKVPVGTLVKDAETDEVLIDMAHEGMRYTICKGGKGGFGNLHYVSSVRQVPTFAQKGAPGETIVVRLELKLLADVGLIGLPNAGKSTLISRISAAKPKIADYPFTTIVPNLGVVSFADTTFTVADMPGLIEGASEGKGLGHQFLKHVERTTVLVHVLDCYPVDESDPVENFRLVESELEQYSEELASRPRIVALNKIDILPAEFVEELETRLKQATDYPVYSISGVTGANIKEFLHEVVRVLEATPKKPLVDVLTPLERTDDSSWEVVEIDGGFQVSGKRLERLIAMTDLDNEEALRYLHRRLQRIGVIQRLREMGAEEGQTVLIGKAEFAFSDHL
ncbi:MAG TPA: GTPase ObgE [Fimbriimonadaceae bacterium]|nr:GTPase ObgE [Fimbriimonadaceae bacterium]